MTYAILLTIHTWMRWLVVGLLVAAIGVSGYGYWGRRPFTSTANGLRHWTATAAHMQLIVGLLLYFKSPLVQHFWSGEAAGGEITFFGWIHALLMLVAIVVLTIGSAKAKRQRTPETQYQTMLWWFLAVFFLLLMAIPWPFMPWAARPLWRSF